LIDLYPHPKFALSQIPTSPRKRGEVEETASALLLGDDLVLDLVVGRLRDDALLHQLVLALVRPARDDFGGIGLADAGSASS
jgi:hypothetical protein